MWFDNSVAAAYDDGLKVGITDAGYRPHRVDKALSNDMLDDQIIAGIRESRFLVADLTGHRQSVYFEAGFAKGLGTPVIYTCRADDIQHLHFDVSHYPVIVWETGEDLRERLAAWIKATVGTGPVRFGAE